MKIVMRPRMKRLTIASWITVLMCALLFAACDGANTDAPLVKAEPRFDHVPSSNGPLIAYVGATLIDGAGKDALSNATILVEGEKIVAAGAGIEIPADAKPIDVRGKWIVPGLIDAHMHFMTSGRIYTRPGFIDLRDMVSYQEEVRWIQNRLPVTLRGLLCAGVTSVVSMGGPEIEYQARALSRSADAAPTVFNAHGVLAPVPEFVAKQIFDPWDGEITIKPMTTQQMARIHVTAAVNRGADLIKTAVDGSGGFVQRVLIRNYPLIHEALIEEASKHGLTVTSHIHELEPARKLMTLGVASLQHIPADAPIDDAFIALAKKRGVTFVPTLAMRKRSFVDVFEQEFDLLPVEQTCGDPDVIQSWFEPEEIPPLQSGRHRDHPQKTKIAYANTKALYDAGVSLAVGADAGLMGLLLGPSLHLELQAMNSAGIPPKDLIVAATLNSAKIAGKEEYFGSVEAGKYADFLILSADPLEDIANLQAIDLIVKQGRTFAQSDLRPPAASN